MIRERIAARLRCWRRLRHNWSTGKAYLGLAATCLDCGAFHSSSWGPDSPRTQRKREL